MPPEFPSTDAPELWGNLQREYNTPLLGLRPPQTQAAPQDLRVCLDHLGFSMSSQISSWKFNSEPAWANKKEGEGKEEKEKGSGKGGKEKKQPFNISKHFQIHYLPCLPTVLRR